MDNIDVLLRCILLVLKIVERVKALVQEKRH